MEHLLPYEVVLNEQWNDLPLPDMNMAWADMKRRLDEDDDKPVIPWWKGCAGWAILAVLLVGIAWWIVRPEKWFNSKHATESVSPDLKPISKYPNDSLSMEHTKSNPDTSVTSADRDSSSKIISTDPQISITKLDPVISTNKTRPAKTKNIRQPQRNIGKKPTRENEKVEIVTSDGQRTSRPSEKNNKPKEGLSVPVIQMKKDSTNDIAAVAPIIKKADTVAKTISPVAEKDSATVKKESDTIAKKKDEKIAVKDPKSKKDSSIKRPMIYSAGLGLYQQIPVAGQKSVPYSSTGRKTSLADYIPSIYFRAEKQGRWFLQSEFRYGAPQQTKEFVFRKDIKTDTGSAHYTRTNTYTLKKTFYHQLPLTFNYYVLPNWSLGAGMQWNKFYSAIADHNLIVRDNFLQVDSNYGTFVQALKRDSAVEFKDSYWQVILQTQYKWKRFTLGARYNIGLQPFINYTLTGNNPQEEKNNSLQVFILFELWKSKKK